MAQPDARSNPIDLRLQSPVVLILFNRPAYTQRVFARIREAQPAQLLVIADGPRINHPTDAEHCAAARAVIDQVDWPCEVQTNYADHNLGCGRRISSGLDWVFAQVEEAIILEDDCLPTADFFPFCAQLLAHYRSDERVMMVSGSNMVDATVTADSYLFSRWYNIWGWATWRRAWQLYDFCMADWPAVRRTRLLETTYPRSYVHRYLRHNFDLRHADRIDTWDIQWFYTCLRSNGLSIVPQVNLIANIGVKGTHTSAGHEGPRPTQPLPTHSLQHPQWLHVNTAYDDALYAARLKPRLRTLVNRLVAALRLRLRRFSLPRG